MKCFLKMRSGTTRRPTLKHSHTFFRIIDLPPIVVVLELTSTSGEDTKVVVFFNLEPAE
jgi:hypothetical protein